jgi:hypothetical protein
VAALAALPCLSPAPQGTGNDWKNLPGTTQFLSTQTNTTMFALIYKIGRNEMAKIDRSTLVDMHLLLGGVDVFLVVQLICSHLLFSQSN